MSSSALQNPKIIAKKDTPITGNSIKKMQQGQEKGKDTLQNQKQNNGSFSHQEAIEHDSKDVSNAMFPQPESFSGEQKQQNMSDEFQNADWNCSFIDNLMQQRGQVNATVVPIELFIEAMHHLERKILGMEQRIEDNEQQTKLNDRLFDLRNNLSQTSHIIANELQTPLAKNKQNFSDSDGFNNHEQIPKNLPSDVLIKQDTLKQQQILFQEECLQQIAAYENKLSMFDKKILHFEEIIHQVSNDIDLKFSEYGKKLNTQLDRFFKAAQSKMEASNEKEQKMSIFEENVTQQIELIKRTLLVREEESASTKEDISLKVQASASACSKIENRLSEFGLEINETKTLLKQIEDDLFIVLQNHKDLQDAIYSYRSVFDEINVLKHAQAAAIQDRKTANVKK